MLIDDCQYWIENQVYDADEIGARFHHRLVSIHCYPNGNGRHARLGTDLSLTQLGLPPAVSVSWPRGSKNNASPVSPPCENNSAY